jgi:hypothetical protein
MKNIAVTLSSVLILMFFLTSCHKKVDVKAEEAAIKAVINAETQAWIDKNPEKMKQYYIHDAYQSRVNIQDSVYTFAMGWDKRAIAIDTLAKYADWRGVDKFSVKKDFMAIKVMGNVAWAIFKETQDMTYYGSPARTIAIITIVLEKVNDQWKISCFIKSNV